MNENFIVKLQTKKYLIGSFDTYQDISKSLIQQNSNLSNDETETILKSMPSSYRAAIVDKNGNYIGYIGLYDIDAKNHTASIRFEVNSSFNLNDKNEILNEFKKYLSESLNITEISEFIFASVEVKNIERKELSPKSNIAIPSKLLIPGISEETLEKFSNDYSIPKLQMPFTIKSSDRIIGIIGLSNLIWANRRATLNLFLDKNLGEDITHELSGYIIDDYINYAHNSNVHNITFSVNGSNDNMLKIINNTNMNYYGSIPYGTNNGQFIESNIMFQHIPNMKKESDIIIPDNHSILMSKLDTGKKELDKHIDLGNGFKLISPKALELEGIDTNDILHGHIKAMQSRQNFAIPLGEDKYFLQKGNGNYGLSKAMMNYSYILLDEKNNYSGYINILRNNANGKNAEIEIGIDPSIQHRGLGTMVINKFYDELFSVGYASVTSAVFEFNNPSLRLHEKVAEFNGIRLEAYYINGQLWNMNFYSKINGLITTEKSTKYR